MAEDGVTCEPLSAGFPANRKKYREFYEYGRLILLLAVVNASFSTISGTSRQLRPQI
jgi:hypothetical protein